MAAGGSATSQVDRIIDNLDASMKRLGNAMRDIPNRPIGSSTPHARRGSSR